LVDLTRDEFQARYSRFRDMSHYDESNG
jgi:hypothetical protein